jgi:hypothetical protein
MEVCTGCWKGIGDVEYVAPADGTDETDKTSAGFKDGG